MIKVLHYIPGFLYGGIESLFLNWYQFKDDEIVDFELLLRTQDDKALTLIKYKEMNGVYYRIPPIKSGIRYYKGIRDFFKFHHDYDILHVHGNNPFIMKQAKKNGIQTIILHSHTSSRDKGWKSFLWSKYGRYDKNKFVDYAFACSKLAAKYTFGDTTFKGQPVTLIYNGIDIKEFIYNEELRRTIRKKMNWENKTIIGHVGRITPPKNQFYLLEIFKELTSLQENVHLVIVGDGPDLEALKTYAKERGIFDQVIFLGSRDDVKDLLQGFDCFLLPSRYEGLPVTLVEAQAAGLPCVISNVITEEADILKEQIYRLSIDQQPEEWAKVIIDVLNEYKRVRKEEEMMNSPFNMVYSTKHLQDKYVEIVNDQERNRSR